MKFFVFLICFLIAAGYAQAKPAEQLRAVEEQLSAGKQQQDQLDQAAKDAAHNLDDLRGRLISSTRALQDKESEEESLEDRQSDLVGEIAEKSTSVAAQRQRLSVMISALLELSSRPPVTLFLQKDITKDHIHRSLLLHAVLPGLKEQAENAARDLQSLYDLQIKLAEQKKLIAQAQDNLQKQRRDLDQLIATRQGSLQRTEAQKGEIARHLAELAGQAQNLHQLMIKLRPPRRDRAAKSAASDISLKWPVAGSINTHFGDRDSAGVTAEGLTLTAPSGAAIVAPRAGKVVFAGSFRGYGKIMILQHPGGYHSFLAGFGRIDAELGQEVEAGEPLGVLPVKPGSKPELYFEWRRGEQPVDPAGGLAMKSL